MGEMDIQSMISDSMFLDTLLFQLRRVIISFSKKLAKESREEEKNQLDTLSFASSEQETSLKKIENFQKKYQGFRENKMRCHQMCSYAEWTGNWEKPSKYFLNLEKNTTYVIQKLN